MKSAVLFQCPVPNTSVRCGWRCALFYRLRWSLSGQPCFLSAVTTCDERQRRLQFRFQPNRSFCSWRLEFHRCTKSWSRVLVQVQVGRLTLTRVIKSVIAMRYCLVITFSIISAFLHSHNALQMSKLLFWNEAACTPMQLDLRSVCERGFLPFL